MAPLPSAKTVGNVHLRQLGDDCATILIGKIAEQRAVVGGFGPQDQSRR